MGRNISIDARRGGGAAHEILFGEVTIEPTIMRNDGTKIVFPDGTTEGINNGRAILEDVDPSPSGPEPAWAYKVTFRNFQTGRAWAETVGVPAGGGALSYASLPRYTTTIPVDVTREQLQNWAELTELAAERGTSEAERATEAADRAEAPTDQMNKNLIETPATQTRVALEEAFAGSAPYMVNDWMGRIGAKLVIPTPDPVAAVGEAVHPSVLYFPERWHGFHYWMGFTPYAGGSDQYEDPCIVASNNGSDWQVPSGLVNPLDDAPGGDKYNSDTNLQFADGKLHLFWRYFDNTAVGAEEVLFLRTSTDGVNWTPKVKVYGSNKTVRRLVSPSFQYIKGTWHMWAVDIVPASKPLVHLTATSLTGSWSAPAVCSVPVRSGKTPWHVHIKRVGTQYVGLMNDTLLGGAGARDGDLILITSSDGLNWESSAKPVIPRLGPNHNNLYAASFVATPFGLDVWYSARITGSPSVWSILRTRLMGWDRGVPYASASGSKTLGTVLANGGSDESVVTFPPGLFTASPIVTVSSANGRVNPAFAALSKDGFTLKGFNWTTGNAVSPILQWSAIQTEN